MSAPGTGQQHASCWERTLQELGGSPRGYPDLSSILARRYLSRTCGGASVCLCKALSFFFFFCADVCMPMHACVCVWREKQDDGWLISKQLRDFDRGVCQIFICVCGARRP